MTQRVDCCVGGTVLASLSNIATNRLHLTERHTLRVILSGAAQRHNGERETHQLPRSRTPKGRRQAESRHSCKALYPNASRPRIKCDSRTFCRYAPPDTPKLPCAATAARKREKFSLPNTAVAVQGSSGRVREVWRVGDPIRKGVPCASKVFPLSSHNRKSTPPRQNAATGCGLNPHGSTRCFHSFVFGCQRRAVLRRTVSEPSSVAARSLVIR